MPRIISLLKPTAYSIRKKPVKPLAFILSLAIVMSSSSVIASEAGDQQALILTAAATGPALIGVKPNQEGKASKHNPLSLSQQELLWRKANRLTFGANEILFKSWSEKGLEPWLDEQLSPPSDPVSGLNPSIKEWLDRDELLRKKGYEWAFENQAERVKINKLSTEEEKKPLRDELNKKIEEYSKQSQRLNIQLALYSPYQIRERATWMWLNHFSVYRYKNNIREFEADYTAKARSLALGDFKELVLNMTTDPAMLLYLDNQTNSVRRPNENLARELLELHTLGVNGGYSQDDVQELARVLTGFGVRWSAENAKVSKERLGDYRRVGAFEFNPDQHDWGNKKILGQVLKSRGESELSEALDIILKTPQSAEFVCEKIATHFLGFKPPQSVVDKMMKAYRTGPGGNHIGSAIKTLALSKEITQTPLQLSRPELFILGSLRFAFDQKMITNPNLVMTWMNILGGSPFLRQTPDGYPADPQFFSSAAQMQTRFEIAKQIGQGGQNLFAKESNVVGFTQLSNRFYFTSIDPWISPHTQKILEQATSAGEWNLLLLSSPELQEK